MNQTPGGQTVSCNDPGAGDAAIYNWVCSGPPPPPPPVCTTPPDSFTTSNGLTITRQLDPPITSGTVYPNYIGNISCGLLVAGSMPNYSLQAGEAAWRYSGSAPVGSDIATADAELLAQLILAGGINRVAVSNSCDASQTFYLTDGYAIFPCNYASPPPPTVTVTPVFLNFPDTPVNNTSAPMNITVTNNSGATIEGGFAGLANADFTCISNCIFTVNDGQSRTIQITFSPLAPVTYNDNAFVSYTSGTVVSCSAIQG